MGCCFRGVERRRARYILFVLKHCVSSLIPQGPLDEKDLAVKYRNCSQFLKRHHFKDPILKKNPN